MKLQLNPKAVTYCLAGTVLAAGAVMSGCSSDSNSTAQPTAAPTMSSPLAQASSDNSGTLPGQDCSRPQETAAPAAPFELAYVVDRTAEGAAVPVPLPGVRDFSAGIGAIEQSGGEITVIYNTTPIDEVKLRVEPPPRPHKHIGSLFCDDAVDQQDKSAYDNWQRKTSGDVAAFTDALGKSLAGPPKEASGSAALNAVRLGSIALNQSARTWPVAPREVLLVDSNRESLTKPCVDAFGKPSVAPGTSYPDPFDTSLNVVCCPDGLYVTVPVGAPADSAGGCPRTGAVDPNWLSLEPAVVLATIKSDPGAVGLIDPLNPQKFDSTAAALLALTRAAAAGSTR